MSLPMPAGKENPFTELLQRTSTMPDSLSVLPHLVLQITL